MKRIWFKSIVIASIILFISGYGIFSQKKIKLDPKNPVSIELWHYYNGSQKQTFDALVSEFNETVGMEKGIIVEAFNQGNLNELVKKVEDAGNKKVGAEEVPNIFAAYADTAYKFDKLGLIIDLNDYLTQEEFDSYIPQYWEEGIFAENAEMKIFPVAKSTEILMLNKTDWDKFAQATHTHKKELQTIEGVTKVAEKYYNWTDSLTEIPDDGKAFFGRDALANYMLIGSKQLGTELFSVSDGKVNFQLDKKIIRKLWDNFYIPYVYGYFTSLGKFRSDDAKTGDIIALVGSTSGAVYFPDKVTLNDTQSYDIEIEAFEAPCFEGAEKYIVQQGAGMVVTKSNEKNEFASVEFLKWFTDKKRNIQFSIESGYLPVKKEVASREALNEALSEMNTTEISQGLLCALPVAFDTILKNNLYTSKAFEHGTQARTILENSMLNQAKSDREKIKALQEDGISKMDAVSLFETDESFEKWYTNFETELYHLIE